MTEGQRSIRQISHRSRGYRRPVRQLIPSRIDPAEPFEIYPAAARPAPIGRPWVMLNMISSIDGATAMDGVSGALGGPGDKSVFGAIRASCDWILVASGTARAERYRIPRPNARTRAARISAGRAPAPRLAVMSGSLEFEPDLPMLADRADQEDPVVVITGRSASPERVSELQELAEVAVVDMDRPTPQAALDVLHQRGAHIVLLEGGPSLNAQFAESKLIDELCISISPKVVAGDSRRMVSGGQALGDLEYELAHLLEHDNMLFVRYVRV